MVRWTPLIRAWEAVDPINRRSAPAAAISKCFGYLYVLMRALRFGEQGAEIRAFLVDEVVEPGCA